MSSNTPSYSINDGMQFHDILKGRQDSNPSLCKHPECQKEFMQTTFCANINLLAINFIYFFEMSTPGPYAFARTLYTILI
jgi:hypothetical protein